MVKYLNFKDKKNRSSFYSKQTQYLVYKFLAHNETIINSVKFKIMLKLQDKLIFSLKNRIINRCIHSGKVRSNSRLSNLVKTSFRENLTKGNVAGFKKASW